MSYHHITAVGRSIHCSLLCAAVGSFALLLAPVSLSAAPPPITDLVCSDEDDRTKFQTIIGYIETKNKAMLSQAISQSPNIVTECHGTNGYNALHYASVHGDIEGAKILLEAGADRRKEALVVANSPCPETPYGVALVLNRRGVGELRPPALLAVLDYDPRDAAWVSAGGSSGSATEEGAGGATATATTETCQLRNNEIRVWTAGRTH